jgi:23S rRNA (cytosine1962-C5)-methyltransferase
MRQAVLRLKRGRDRARVHPWIFKGDVADVSDVAPGSAVTVIDSMAQFVGRGFYNPRPALCCRILTRADETIDRDFFRRRIDAAIARRPNGSSLGVARLVWSEGDALPGLVVDRYGPVVVIQCLTLGMTRVRDDVVAVLRERFGDIALYCRDDDVAATLEGFVPLRGWWAGADEGPESVVVEEAPIKLRVTFASGQKTGLYLDQSDNRRRVGALARGRSVLDAFAYTAGFACHALVEGATHAIAIESSPEAIAGARANFELNGVAERAEIVPGNVFDELRRLDRDGARFGVIVLDPPPFARSRAALDAAARGYKEINLRAMRLLEPGGHLATFSCSHHVSDALFVDICRDAAVDASVELRVRATLRQAADHPTVLTIPETHYLKGLLLEAS